MFDDVTFVRGNASEIGDPLIDLGRRRRAPYGELEAHIRRNGGDTLDDDVVADEISAERC